MASSVEYRKIIVTAEGIQRGGKLGLRTSPRDENPKPKTVYIASFLHFQIFLLNMYLNSLFFSDSK